MTNIFSHIPHTFQEETLLEVSRLVKRGFSVQLTGPAGSGGTLLIKALLLNPGIKNKYFGQDYKLFLVDSYSVLEKKPLALARLLLSSLGEQTGIDDSMVMGKIEQRIEGIAKESKLLVIFDHFQELNKEEFRVFFNNLYRIYRLIEGKIAFIFVSEKALDEKTNLDNFSDLARIIRQNIVKIKPLSKSDSDWFIKENMHTKGVNEKLTKKIYYLSGGFPRTIKRITEALNMHTIEDIEANPLINTELAIHLQGLQNSDMCSSIPLLDIFNQVKNRQSTGEQLLNIEFGQRLTKSEELVFKILIKNKGKIVSREEIISAVWGDKALDISDHAYDQLLLRLRKKLAQATPKLQLQTIKGRGHLLS